MDNSVLYYLRVTIYWWEILFTQRVREKGQIEWEMASGLIKRKNWFQSNIMCMAESGTFLKGVFLLPAGVVHYPAGVGNSKLCPHNAQYP